MASMSKPPPGVTGPYENVLKAVGARIVQKQTIRKMPQRKAPPMRKLPYKPGSRARVRTLPYMPQGKAPPVKKL
jgi:hypothetical protein